MRERYIDIAKGIGIWCIVLLHYEDGIFPDWLNCIIGNFMITIFYIAAGWIMSMKSTSISTKDLFYKRMQTLGRPYLYWSVIILLFDLLLWVFNYYDTYFIAREVYKTLVLRGIGTLWFLPALMGGELILNWLINKKSRSLFISIVVLFLIYRYLYSVFFHDISGPVAKIIQAPFQSIHNVFDAFFHIASGFFLYKLTIFIQSTKTKILFVALLSILSGVLLLFSYFTLPLVGFISHLSASIILPFGVLLLCKVINQSPFFEYWGQQSLSLMVTHYSIVLVLFSILTEHLLEDISPTGFHGWACIFFFFFSIPIQYYLSKLLLGKFPYLIGKY